MDSGDDPVGYVMCAINAYSSVLIMCSCSLGQAGQAGQPPRTASARAHAPCSGSSQSLQQLQSLHSLPGVAGQGFALACVRVCLRLRVRLACVRVRAAWSSWCVRVCLRACARVRAAARVRSRCSSRQLHFLRRAFGRRVAGEFVVEVRGGSEAEESVH